MGRRWLLEASIGGVTRRWCDGADDVSVGGYLWTAKLPRGLSVARPTSAAVSVDVQVVEDTDWSALVAAGAVLEEHPATLYRWTEGTALDQATVWVQGRVRGVVVGRKGDGIAFAVATDGARDTNPLLLPQSRIDLSTMPATSGNVVRDDASGEPYPLVIGFPGHFPTLGAPLGVVPVFINEFFTPANPSDTQILLCEGAVSAATVRIQDVENALADQFTTRTRRDNLGQLISYTTYADDAGGTFTRPDQEEAVALWCGWGDQSGYGGGLRDPFGSGPIRGAGQAIRWAMRRAGGRLAFDHEDFERFVAWFDTVEVDTWTNDPDITAWEWVQDVVLPMVPHRLVQTGRGLSVRPWDWSCTVEQSVAVLEQGRNVVREGKQTAYAAGGVVNEVTVEYRASRGGESYGSRRVLSAEPGRIAAQPFASLGQDDRVHPHPLARASQQHYGQAYPVTVELLHCYHDRTALRVAADILRAQALPHMVATYTAQDPELERLLPGDIVTLTDSELSYSAVPALVNAVQAGGGAPVLEVVIPHAAVRGG